MIVHDSEHWTNGGTGMTNFPAEHFPVYEEAVRRNGNDKFIVSSTRMLGRGRNSHGGSLHYLGIRQCEEHANACEAFWKTFDEVKKEMDEVYEAGLRA